MTDPSSRLTPGQTAIPRLAVTGERVALPFDARDWRVTVEGLVAAPLVLTLDEIRAMPAVDRVWDTICVTGWTRLDTRWRGVRLADVLARAKPLAEAAFVRFTAHSPRAHDTSLPLDYAREHCLLAYECDGRPLGPEHGHPLRVVTRGKYFYKSLKWLVRLELLRDDRLGFWERTSAYHNGADPWLEQRYVPRQLPPDEIDRRREARDFSGVVAIRDDGFRRLRGADLSGANFAGAQIKSSPLAGVNLAGARAPGANFTLSDFRAATLAGADLSNADLEGAIFINSDLRGADLRGASLTMARFAHATFGADIAGARFLRSGIAHDGVAEVEQAYLLDPARGAIVE